jgi:hypothetical protein
MDPDQPGIPPPGNNYDFIVNPDKPTGPKSSNPIKNPFVLKLVLILGGALVFVLLASFAVNLFFGDKTNVTDLVQLTQTETEIGRIAALGNQTDGQDTRNAAVNDYLVVTNQRNEWLAFLAKGGHKVAPKVLNLKKNKTTDNRLNSAKQISTFDKTYAQVMRELLTNYLTDLKNAHTNAFGKKEKDLLQKHYAQTQILLAQWPQ